MQNTIEIKHLSREEKLRVMEAIWEDLSNEEEQVESPDWHKKALQETEHRLNTGQEKTVDWQDAKKELRQRYE
jgi:phosphoribosylanthranilate isomerase